MVKNNGIDFTNCEVDFFKGYDGASGGKRSIFYNGIRYMLKFPSKAPRNKEINYYDFISSLSNEDCNKALIRVHPRIDTKKIDNMIDMIKGITEDQKEFYKVMIRYRKERILDFSIRKMKDCGLYDDLVHGISMKETEFAERMNVYHDKIANGR